LFESGYDPKLKTLFIWQGVTMYLNPKSVDATLAFVVNHSAPGSAIVFDYVYRSDLDFQKRSEIRNMRRYRFITGEGLTFGIPQNTIKAYLTERGFHQVEDINADDLKTAYFSGKNAGRKVAGGYGIAIGKVQPERLAGQQ
jgi:methyltransferase (TIGR00027 family)